MVCAVVGYFFPSVARGGFIFNPFSEASNAEVGITALMSFFTALILFCIPDNKK